jgi:hypothetical protein
LESTSRETGQPYTKRRPKPVRGHAPGVILLIAMPHQEHRESAP